MLSHNLDDPAYNPPDCPAWAKETLPAFVQPFRGLNGLPPVYRDTTSPLAPNLRGIDLYQANQFLVYRPETADYLYGNPASLQVAYPRGLLPAYEALAAEVVKGGETTTGLAIALLAKTVSQVKHPTIPPCGVRVPPDRGLDDEALLKSGFGWCNEQARVFVRLCQVCNIPARIIQIYYSDGKSGHCIAEFYANGRWCMADASWHCIFPEPDGRLLSAAQCHDRGEGQFFCGVAYHRRRQELLKLSDEQLNIDSRNDPFQWRKRFATETAEDLANSMGWFGVVNYPLPA